MIRTAPRRDARHRPQPRHGVARIETVLAHDLPPHGEQQPDLLARDLGPGARGGDARLELVGVRRRPADRASAPPGDQRVEDRPDLRAVDVRDDLRVELRRQVPLQRPGLAARAKADDLVTEPHHLGVGLDVALLAHEVEQVVAAALELIQPRGGLAQRALGTDLVVVHGKQPHQLLDIEVHRGDLGRQQRRDVALEQIRVADQHPAQPQMGHERDQQRHAPARDRPR